MKINLLFCEVDITITSTTLRNKIKKEYKTFGKIHAVKLHRKLTNSGLLEAKRYTDQFDDLFKFEGGEK